MYTILVNLLLERLWLSSAQVDIFISISNKPITAHHIYFLLQATLYPPINTSIFQKILLLTFFEMANINKYLLDYKNPI